MKKAIIGYAFLALVAVSAATVVIEPAIATVGNTLSSIAHTFEPANGKIGR